MFSVYISVSFTYSLQLLALCLALVYSLLQSFLFVSVSLPLCMQGHNIQPHTFSQHCQRLTSAFVRQVIVSEMARLVPMSRSKSAKYCSKSWAFYGKRKYVSNAATRHSMNHKSQTHVPSSGLGPLDIQCCGAIGGRGQIRDAGSATRA